MSAPPLGFPKWIERADLERLLEELHQPVFTSTLEDSPSWDLSYEEWCLIELPLDVVAELGCGPGCENSPKKARDYARSLTPFPPVVLTHWVIDGYHRITAAYMRGDTTIWAYVPCERYDDFAVGQVPHST